MISVSRFNRTTLYLNATLIEMVEATPDTMITLITGKKLLVRESVEEVLTQIEGYYRRVGLLAVQIKQKAEAEDEDVS